MYTNKFTGNQTLRALIAPAVPSPASVVARCYIYFASLPTPNSTYLFGIESGGGERRGVYYHAPTHTLRAGGPSASNLASGGAVVTTGQWYRIDIMVLFQTIASVTCYLNVDGVGQPNHTLATTNSTGFSVTVGGNDTTTMDVYYDDIIVTGNQLDFPIGAGTVVGLYPNSDGVHGGAWASGVFGKGAGGATPAASTDTDIWQSLNKPIQKRLLQHG
jgi:hypothetical protein